MCRQPSQKVELPSADSPTQHGVEDAALHAAGDGPRGHVLAGVTSSCTARACQRLQAFHAATGSSSPPACSPHSPDASIPSLTPSPAAQALSQMGQASPSGAKQRKRPADGEPAAAESRRSPTRTAADKAAGAPDADLSHQAAPVRVGSDPLASTITGESAGQLPRCSWFLISTPGRRGCLCLDHA